jgi:hypothetical protein
MCPSVPEEFWDYPSIVAATEAQHLGRLVRAYRHHPFHGRVLAQAEVGSWVGYSQPQVTRIERGSRIRDLDRLIMWARARAVPEARLWFRLPSTTGGSVEDGLATTLSSAASESMRMARTAAARIKASELDDIESSVTALARRYVGTPPAEMFYDLCSARDRIVRYLDCDCHPADRQQLHKLAGQVCGMLANASDGVEAALAPVFGTPPTHRIYGLTKQLGVLESEVSQCRLARTLGGQRLLQRIRDFSRDAAPPGGQF